MKLALKQRISELEQAMSKWQYEVYVVFEDQNADVVKVINNEVRFTGTKAEAQNIIDRYKHDIFVHFKIPRPECNPVYCRVVLF